MLVAGCRDSPVYRYSVLIKKFTETIRSVFSGCLDVLEKV